MKFNKLFAVVLGSLLVFALSLPVMAQSTTQSTTTTTRQDSPTQSTTTTTQYPAYSPEAQTIQEVLQENTRTTNTKTTNTTTTQQPY